MAHEGEHGTATPGSESVPPGALSSLLRELAGGGEGSEWDRALRPGAVIGRFELVRELGRGGFGVVYEAEDRELHRTVAFKAVRAGARRELNEEQLLREAEAAARLSHPNIVTLYDVGRSDHGPYLILELLRGETLAQRLELGPLSLREALRIAVEVSKGVAHAHAHGVVHRDLTPGNVFLCEDGQVKVLDLGMAHAFGRRAVAGGTPAYMAPEQWRGAPEDERTDVFALGVILHQMLSNELPFPERGGRLCIPETAPSLEVADLPALGELVSRMLARDPVERPRDAAEVLAALTAFQQELARAPSVSGPVRARTSGRWRRVLSSRHAVRARLAVAVLAMGFLAGALGLGWYLLGGRHTPTAQEHGSAATVPSIAVLPFADLSAQRDQEYFSDGLSEEILNALARVEGLRVTGRTSSFAFKGKADDLRTIGRKLGVSAVLEGSVRKEGNRVRITAQLVKVADGYHLWADSYDRELTEVFAVQEQIAHAVVGALQVKLLPGRGPSTRAHRTANSEAHNQYLLGRQFYNRGLNGPAREAFERAIALDPGYAPAHAWLATVLRFLVLGAGTAAGAAELRNAARAAAEKAVALGPDLGDAYSARAVLRQAFDRDWTRAETDLMRAVALNPADSFGRRQLGYALRNQGRLADGLAAMRRAAELDPLDPNSWIALGLLLLETGRCDLARSALLRSLEISPDDWFPRVLLAHCYLLEGHPRAALAELRSLPPGAQSADSARDGYRLGVLAIAEHDLGNIEESQRALEELITKYGHNFAFIVASIYAWRGDRDHAFEWLERGFHEGQDLLGVKSDPFLRELRDDPRYTALLRKMNLPLD